jgi:predicted RNA binding protein YcfA (HicA-like mRNA interferase family)
MPRLTPASYRDLIRVFLKVGFKISRQEGSHIIMSRPGMNRPIVIPKYDEIGVPLIKNCLKTAGIDRNEYFRLLQD